MAKKKTPGGTAGKGGVNPAPTRDDQTVRIAAEQLTMVPIDDLIPYANNAKKHGVKQINQIRASLREFGFVTPVLIDFDNNIIAGHGRVEAARAEGMSEVPCVLVTNLTEAQRKAYILADNRLSETAVWDTELLKIELEGLEALDFDTGIAGFDAEAMDELGVEIGRSHTQAEAYEDDFDEDPPEDSTVREGDIYQLGRHRLMCGNATSLSDVQALTGGAQVDLLLTDPPYNVALGMNETPEEAARRNRRTDGKIVVNDSMSDEQFLQFLCDAFSAAVIELKPGGTFYVWHSDSAGYWFRAAMDSVGLKVRQCLIWEKNSLIMGRQDYQWQHEPCLYGWKDGAAHAWYSDRKQSTILRFDKPTRSKEHPTMKPVALIAYQIGNSTKPGDSVLDPFGGSGTTLIACEQLGRTCYMMEIDPKYVQVIINRWEAMTREKAVLLNDRTGS